MVPGVEGPRYITVSECLDFQHCPSYWTSKWYYRRSVKGLRRAALDIGRSFHHGWEMAMKAYQEYRGASLDGLKDATQWEGGLHHSYLAAAETRNLQPQPDDLRVLSVLAKRAAWWWGRDPSCFPFDEILSVERTLERPLMPGVILRGRLDAIVRKEGALKPVRHLQLKTSGSKTPAVTVRIIKRSLHESAYRYLGEEQYPNAWGGTHLELFLKLPEGKKTGSTIVPRNPEEAIVSEDLNVSDEIYAARLADLRTITFAITTAEQHLKDLEASAFPVPCPLPIEQREAWCGGLHGNVECEYMDSCNGISRLDDPWIYETADPLAHYEEAVE